MAAFRTLLFLVIFYGGTLFHVAIAFIGSFTSTKLMRWGVSNWSWYQLFCARHILGIRVQIDGDVPNRPVIYAVKHESMFETIHMPSMFYHPSVVAKIQLARIPFWGFAARKYGMIFVDRDGGATALRTMLIQARSVIAQGRPIVIFPEGTRVQHGQRADLQPGFAGIYKMLGVPVVPIAVDSGKCITRDSWIYRSGTITYKVGDEIPPGLRRAEIESRVQDAINALNG